MNSPIYPMTFIPKKMNFKLYYVAFPTEWKEYLVQLQLSVNKDYDLDHYLKLFGLKACLNGWLDEVVNVGNMKANSDDSRWFVSLNEPDVDKICDILKIWVAAEYSGKKATAETAELVGKFLGEIDPDVLKYGITSEEVCLFNEDGTAAVDYAFDAFALYAANAFIGKTIPLFGQELTFSNYGLKKLFSQPIEYSKQYYSYGLQFSVQTTPPQRECMLLVFPSVKRFISNAWTENIYLKENINALVKMSENKYRVMKMKQMQKYIDKKNVEYFREWNDVDINCYKLYHNSSNFPAADEVLKHPEKYVGRNARPQILLPYKFGMDFTNMKIGTGVSVKEKCEFYKQITHLLKDIAEPMGEVEPVGAVHYNRPDKKVFELVDIQKMRRERLKACTGRDNFTIEIYGHDSDEPLKNAIIEDICQYFGNTDGSGNIKIETVKRGIGFLGDMMNSNRYDDHLLRIKKVQESVEKSAEIKGAIIILKNTVGEKGDPKAALRAGFADANRLTQFIVPDVLDEKAKDKPSKSRIHGAVLDIFRQFGYTDFADNRNTVKNPACAADVIGVYAYQTLRPLWAADSKSATLTAKFLPAYVTFNARSGKIKVECGLFDEKELSYPEALIAFSKLSRKDDFVDKCNKAARGGFVTKLLGLRERYHDNDGLVLVLANGVTRSLWHGISDTSISGYNMKKPFVPEKIKIGNSISERTEAFTDSHLRIIRLREGVSTLEVPDYYTEINAKGDFTRASGVYRHKDVFWGIDLCPNNFEFKDSYKKCRADRPTLNFDECALVEYYPLQLREEDDPKQWVGYANLLRELMPENPSRKSVRLPAPLHLAKLMSEYFLLYTKEK